MRTRILLFGFLLLLLAGCASTPYQKSEEPESYPSGPGTIPPSWYDYDPALRHWFDPWYVNPYYLR